MAWPETTKPERVRLRPGLLLGLLGMIGYIGGWFGPNTVEIIESKIVTFSGTIFSESVVDQIIRPTVTDVLQRGRPEIISVGFLLSLWAGSSAISTFVDSIVEAHGQQDAKQRQWMVSRQQGSGHKSQTQQQCGKQHPVKQTLAQKHRQLLPRQRLAQQPDRQRRQGHAGGKGQQNLQ